MTSEGAATTYATTAAAGGVLWVTPLETWFGWVIAALTIAVLLVRLWVDVPRGLRNWRNWRNKE